MGREMLAVDLLRTVDAGNSVAEFDTDLEKYFVETETFRSVISGEKDIIAGDKGTGKTAIFRVLQNSYRSYPTLEHVEIITAFNPQGNPIFQKIASGEVLSEGLYQTIWKAYLLSLVGNWIVNKYTKEYNNEIRNLSHVLDHLGLSSEDISPETIFGKLADMATRLTKPKSIEATITMTEAGLPVIVPKVEFGPAREEGSFIYNDDYLGILDAAARSTDLTLWVLFDRLDEAFTGFPKTEVPALRALFRTYLDLSGLTSIKLKLFIRKDLLRKVAIGGFVNLTHINAKKIEIVWDDEDLLSMLVRRIKRNDKFVSESKTEDVTDVATFGIIFPPKIDNGQKKPSTETWIMTRIRDGKGIKPPRNLIDLFNKARENQLRREQREGRQIDPARGPIIEADSVKRAFSQLSDQRVQDTLIAEAGELADTISKFRDGKSEHNHQSLEDLLGASQIKTMIQGLVDIGFLEEFGVNYKIPMLYRGGLRITQGKAFS
jgi:hypothetical protein